jgi:hypothetical protein
VTTLSRHDLDVGLRRLGELAVARGIEIDLVVVGGAAMVLGFAAREATKDVDVLVRAPAAAIVRQLAADLAEELGWPADWLNDAAKGFVGQPSPGPILLEAPGIVARAVSVEQLLALKLAAWRDDVDIDDARLLLRNCPSVSSRDALWSRVGGSCRAAASRPRGTLSSISGKNSMVRIEDIARAALAYEALTVRELIQDLLRDPPDWASIPRPAAVDEKTLVVAAALLELLALRSGAEPAAWTRDTGPAREPIHLVRAAATMPRTRAHVEAESPEPLRKRNVFAPTEYATFV